MAQFLSASYAMQKRLINRFWRNYNYGTLKGAFFLGENYVTIKNERRYASVKID